MRAVLGPTNTGKTWYAMDRMLAHKTGMLGLPLRLLAREVYDKICLARGPAAVALVTGEERIVPEKARYWVCTVEAMPVSMGADFLGVDEIQLCADPERGHVFTDRLLSARGSKETLFLGSSTMQRMISELVPEAGFQFRRRLSNLSYTGARKISRLKPRSAVVGFSVEDVYSIAELIRRQRGGAAVVMGALSPRTRNAQVALYQNGDVDFLVATDAIGMGLNLAINHVAFSGLTKFDGRRIRRLQPNELAQVAGRAGRHRASGTFGVTGDAQPLHSEIVSAIEENRFAPVQQLQWRNTELDFRSAKSLIASLEMPSENKLLVRSRDADDFLALTEICQSSDIPSRLASEGDVKLLWNVCQIPDFCNVSSHQHAEQLKKVFSFIHDIGYIPDAWLEQQVRRVDRTDGDVDTLSKRIAQVRTWTYVSQRADWVQDSNRWSERARDLEARLSDALHDSLTNRFVDRRASVLLKTLKRKDGFVANVDKAGEIHVEGERVGRLEGFRFRQEPSSTPEETKAVRAASLQALASEYNLRASRIYSAPNKEIDFTEQGGLMWGEHAVGRITAGGGILSPDVEVFVDDEAGSEVRRRVGKRLTAFLEQKVASLCEQLLALRADEELAGPARAFSYALVEAFGVLRRGQVAEMVKSLDQDARRSLRKHGVRFGQYTIFVHSILKPEATRLRLVLWSLAQNLKEFPSPPPPGLVTIPVIAGAPKGYYPLSGFFRVGDRAIRIDMLERLANLIREHDSRAGFESTADMLSISGLTLDQFAGAMRGLGYSAERREREKIRAPKHLPDGESVQRIEDESGTKSKDKPRTALKALAAESNVDASETRSRPGDAAEVESGSNAGSSENGKVKAENAAAGGDEAAAQLGDAAEGTDQALAADEKPEEPEKVVFYTFKWEPRQRKVQSAPNADAVARKHAVSKHRGGMTSAPKKRAKSRKPVNSDQGEMAARSRKPAKVKDKPKDAVDPNSPFAVLSALKNKL